MNTSFLVQDLTNNNWIELDLYEDLPINVVIQSDDITDISSRRTNYSKTFQLPGTKINNAYFENAYEVNGTSFDALSKRRCIVQYKGTQVFKGYLRLNSITIVEDKIQYEAYILSEITDFSSIIADKTLRDLSWSHLTHVQDYDSVFQSWYATSGDTQGLLNGNIIYPMIHYGYDYQDTTGSTKPFTFAINSGTEGIDFSGSSIPPTYFKPAIRVKHVLDVIFSGSGYEIQSNFFDTPYFRSIYMDLAANGKLGVEVASGVTNQNIFRTYGFPPPAPQTFNYTPETYIQQIKFGRIDDTDGYDPSLNFDTQFSAYQIPYTGNYSFELLAQINQIFANNTIATYYGISIYKAPTPQGLLDPNVRQVAGGTPDSFFALNRLESNNRRILINEVPLNAGDWVGIFVRFNQSPASNRFAGLSITGYEGNPFGARWELFDSPFFVANSLVDMKLQFPELSSLEFVKAIIKMFNMVVIPTEDQNIIRMEPLPWYYAEVFAETKDWTRLLDTSQAIKIQPLDFQLKKNYYFQYLSGDEEYLNKLWEDTYDVPYGTKRYSAVGDILTGEEKIEFPFRATPTDVISGSTNIIIPQYYKFEEGTEREVAYSNKNHIFFWVGNRYFYGQSGNTEQKTWYMTSGGTPVELTTYPCVSHLSTLDSQDPERISDLNFDKNFDFFGNTNPVIEQFTSYNLYQLWYGDYFRNLFSPETRRLTGRFLLNPMDISEINLTDKIYVKDGYYNIEKINEANLIDWKLTEVSLIKKVSSYGKIVPPAPTHDILPNDTYPASGSVYTLSAYVSTNQFVICNNSITGSTIYSSTPTLVENSFIYQDALGTSPYPKGYFVKETPSSTVYVTINNLGQLSQDDCP